MTTFATLHQLVQKVLSKNGRDLICMSVMTKRLNKRQILAQAWFVPLKASDLFYDHAGDFSQLYENGWVDGDAWEFPICAPDVACTLLKVIEN